MKRLSLYLGTAFALLLVVVHASPVAAVSSSGLSITPRKNYTVKAGQSVTDKLTIGNLNSSADLNLTLNVVDFTYMDDTGTPKLNLDQNAARTPWSLNPYLTLPKTVVVPAGQSRSVDLTINIPEGQGAGSYYSAIQYGTGSADGGNVSLSASGVSLVFVSVPGVVRENMSLKQFGAYQSNKDKNGGKYLKVATTTPTEIGFTLKNEGNVAEAPAGSIDVKYMFGKKDWHIDNANPTSSLALLGQSRLFLSCFETSTKEVSLQGQTTQAKECKTPSMWPGRYTATLGVFYGQNGNNTNEINGISSFWYLPWWFIITVSAILVLLIVAVLVIVRKVRNSKRSSYRKTR